jgi:hypothetical protein
LSEDRQIYVPGSFIALYVPVGQIKPIKPREEIEAKYDYCEDLAQLLLQAMYDKMAELNLPIDIAFSRVSNVLADPNLNLSEVESTWVLSRLNELSESDPSFR